MSGIATFAPNTATGDTGLAPHALSGHTLLISRCHPDLHARLRIDGSASDQVTLSEGLLLREDRPFQKIFIQYDALETLDGPALEIIAFSGSAAGGFATRGRFSLDDGAQHVRTMETVVDEAVSVVCTAGGAAYASGESVGGILTFAGFYRAAPGLSNPSRLDRLFISDHDAQGPALIVLVASARIQTVAGGTDVFQNKVAVNLGTAWNDSLYVVSVTKIAAADWITSSGSKFVSVLFPGGLLVTPQTAADDLYVYLVADGAVAFTTTNALNVRINGRWGAE